MITGAGEFFGPNAEIGVIVGGQSAAFFDIEKDDGTGSEAFPLRSGRSIARVLGSVSSCRDFILELAAVAATVQNQKAETLGAEKFSLAEPRICFLSGRRAEPVAGKHKCLLENRQCEVTGIHPTTKHSGVRAEGTEGTQRGIRAARRRPLAVRPPARAESRCQTARGKRERMERAWRQIPY